MAPTCEGVFLLVVVHGQAPDEGLVGLALVLVVLVPEAGRHGGGEQRLVGDHLLVRLLFVVIVHHGQPMVRPTGNCIQ